MRCRMHSKYRLTCPTCSRLNRENYNRGRSSGRVTGSYNVSTDYVFLTGIATSDNTSNVPDGGGGASVDFGTTYSSSDGGSSYTPSTDSSPSSSDSFGGF